MQIQYKQQLEVNLALKGQSGGSKKPKCDTGVEGFLEMDRKLTQMQEQNQELEQKLKKMSEMQKGQQNTANDSEVLQDMLSQQELHFKEQIKQIQQQYEKRLFEQKQKNRQLNATLDQLENELVIVSETILKQKQKEQARDKVEQSFKQLEIQRQRSRDRQVNMVERAAATSVERQVQNDRRSNHASPVLKSKDDQAYLNHLREEPQNQSKLSEQYHKYQDKVKENLQRYYATSSATELQKEYSYQPKVPEVHNSNRKRNVKDELAIKQYTSMLNQYEVNQSFASNGYNHKSAERLPVVKNGILVSHEDDKYFELKKTLERSLSRNSEWKARVQNLGEKNKWENVKPMIYREFSHPGLETQRQMDQKRSQRFENLNSHRVVEKVDDTSPDTKAVKRLGRSPAPQIIKESPSPVHSAPRYQPEATDPARVPPASQANTSQEPKYLSNEWITQKLNRLANASKAPSAAPQTMKEECYKDPIHSTTQQSFLDTTPISYKTQAKSSPYAAPSPQTYTAGPIARIIDSTDPLVQRQQILDRNPQQEPAKRGISREYHSIRGKKKSPAMATSSQPSVQKRPAPVPSIYDETLFSPAKKGDTIDFSFQNGEQKKVINQSNLQQNDLYSQETFSEKNHNFDGNQQIEINFRNEPTFNNFANIYIDENNSSQNAHTPILSEPINGNADLAYVLTSKPTPNVVNPDFKENERDDILDNTLNFVHSDRGNKHATVKNEILAREDYPKIRTDDIISKETELHERIKKLLGNIENINQNM